MNASDVKFIAIHCSATKPSVNVDAAMIDRWHRKQGWLQIGYHFVITRAGKVEKGRPLGMQGAHVAGFNDRSIGICLAGGIGESSDRPENNFTDDQFAALGELLNELRPQFPADVVVQGHRDFFGDTNKDGVIDRRDWLKDCPCFDVKSWVKETGVWIQKQ